MDCGSYLGGGNKIDYREYLGKRAKIWGSYGTIVNIEPATYADLSPKPGYYSIQFKTKLRRGRITSEGIESWQVKEDDIHLVKERMKNPMAIPIRIPKKVLAWRERQPKGKIMRPRTFKRITKEAKKIYRKKSAGPAAGGKAYWITLLRKYIDTHPGDVAAMRVLKKLVERRYKKNPSLKSRPKRELSVPEKHQIRIARDTLKMSDIGARIMGGMTKEEAREVLRKHGIMSPRENPRDKWYIGILKKGGANLFQASKQPMKREYPQYRRVFGPFVSDNSAWDWWIKWGKYRYYSGK